MKKYDEYFILFTLCLISLSFYGIQSFFKEVEIDFIKLKY